MYVLSLQAHQHNQKPQTLFVWINQATEQAAKNSTKTHLTQQQWIIDTIESIHTTEAEDYFPPCLSFDAFNLASKQGFAFRQMPAS